MDKKKVMVLDDEEDFLKIAKINLESTGKYEVMTMSDGRDILSRVKSFHPDVILMDILMPKIDGVEVCQMLNEDTAGKKIPIIALSALDTDKDKLMMYKLGVVDFLTKPIEIDELISKIEKALEYK
ncbi:MAG: response regulator [Candidatus Aadella gelida]|nr:response regulator [Candidatus Aadella gelida]